MKKNQTKVKYIIVGGPTGSGKTKIGIEIATEFKGAIVNADSRQVFKLMDIGTAKGKIKHGNEYFKTKDFQVDEFFIQDSNVRGYLFDIVFPDEDFSLVDYHDLTRRAINRISKDGSIPILVGGTGLYIDAVLKKYQFTGTKPDSVLRNELNAMSLMQLTKKLRMLSSSRYEQFNESDKKNPRRLIRAIEKIAHGNIFTSKQQVDGNNHQDVLFVYPKYNREELFEIINSRVDAMIDEGFVDEVKDLIDKGYLQTNPMKSMAYHEVVKYLKNEYTLDEVVQMIKQKHRNFAKRQATWFESQNRQYDLQQFDFNTEKGLLFKCIQQFLK